MLFILDLGAHDGCSIRKFKKEYLKNIPDNQYIIYSFEAHPFFIPYLNNEANKYNNINILNKAVSNKNDTVNFYYSKLSDGSSLNSNKITNEISCDNYITVECIDIVEFINKLNLNQNDQLWIKMDIEGEEYNIIEHLHKNNIIPKINKLFIEWHYKKISNISKDIHDNCVKILDDYKIKTIEWDALKYKTKNINDKYKLYITNLI